MIRSTKWAAGAALIALAGAAQAADGNAKVDRKAMKAEKDKIEA